MVAAPQCEAVVFDRFLGHHQPGPRGNRHGVAGGRLVRRPRVGRRRGNRLGPRRRLRWLHLLAIDGRQEERECASHASLAFECEVTAQQLRDLAADRQPQPGSAVAPAGGAVRLLEGLENGAMFLGRNADAGVRHGEGHHPLGAIQAEVPGPPTGCHRLDLHPHRTPLGELKSIRYQVFQDLVQPCAIGLDGFGQTRVGVHHELDALAQGDVREVLYGLLAKVGQVDRRRLDVHPPRFDP